nr:MAG TPA: hypothetical protein [Caudoviricetes sp.]
MIIVHLKNFHDLVLLCLLLHIHNSYFKAPLR